jgi:hypothetical protein
MVALAESNVRLSYAERPMDPVRLEARDRPA